MTGEYPPKSIDSTPIPPGVDEQLDSIRLQQKRELNEEPRQATSSRYSPQVPVYGFASEPE